MSIPKHDQIRVPALSLLADRGQLKLREFEQPLAKYFGLSDSEVQEEYDSGNGKIFYDRISWALSYMNMAGLLNKPKWGVYEINELGKERLKAPEVLNQFIAAQFTEQQENKLAKSDKAASDEESLTPQEELYESAKKISQARYQELIDTILSKTPREFESLVVLLLQKMGYGGEITQSGLVTSYTNDGGIDGIIKEDVLGFGRIHIQAKRYAQANSVGRQEIQSFVGALAVAQSNKGVFITTSSFSKGAVQYTAGLNGNTTLILIDGQKLAEYLYEYGVGVQVEHTVQIKNLDSEFWDSMENEAAGPDL